MTDKTESKNDSGVEPRETVLEVIESQDAVAQARLDLAREVAAFNLAQVRLLAAAGVITAEMIVPD